MNTKAYNAWSKSEASSVPTTDEGVGQASKRWFYFNKGYNAGIKEAVEYLKELHEIAQDRHNYYCVAANAVSELKEKK
jgi:hypothetical protein